MLRVCINCNNPVKDRHSKFYCSHKCQVDFQYKTYINRWLNGAETGMSGKYDISNYIRRYLFEKYNSSCSVCGWSKVNDTTGKIPLEIEHIDGCYINNTVDNLTLLCPNCHSLTSTYKSLNKGRGRKSRSRYTLYPSKPQT